MCQVKKDANILLNKESLVSLMTPTVPACKDVIPSPRAKMLELRSLLVNFGIESNFITSAASAMDTGKTQSEPASLQARSPTSTRTTAKWLV